MTTARKPTLDEMQQLGAKDGQALGRGLAAQIREAVTQDEADHLLQIANIDVVVAMNRLREAGLQTWELPSVDRD